MYLLLESPTTSHSLRYLRVSYCCRFLSQIYLFVALSRSQSGVWLTEYFIVSVTWGWLWELRTPESLQPEQMIWLHSNYIFRTSSDSLSSRWQSLSDLLLADLLSVWFVYIIGTTTTTPSSSTWSDHLPPRSPVVVPKPWWTIEWQSHRYCNNTTNPPTTLSCSYCESLLLLLVGSLIKVDLSN